MTSLVHLTVTWGLLLIAFVWSASSTAGEEKTPIHIMMCSSQIAMANSAYFKDSFRNQIWKKFYEINLIPLSLAKKFAKYAPR